LSAVLLPRAVPNNGFNDDWATEYPQLPPIRTSSSPAAVNNILPDPAVVADLAARLAPLLAAAASKHGAGVSAQALADALKQELGALAAAAMGITGGGTAAEVAATPTPFAVTSSPFADPAYNNLAFVGDVGGEPSVGDYNDGLAAWISSTPSSSPSAAAAAAAAFTARRSGSGNTSAAAATAAADRACAQVAALALALLMPSADDDDDDNPMLTGAGGRSTAATASGALESTYKQDPSTFGFYVYGDGKETSSPHSAGDDEAAATPTPYALPPGATAARLLRLNTPALLKRLVALIAGSGASERGGSAHATSVWVMGVLREVAPRLGLLEIGVVLATVAVR